MTDNITDSMNKIKQSIELYYANKEARILKLQNTILETQKDLLELQVKDLKEKIKNLKDDLKSSERKADFYFNLWRKKSNITVEKMVS